MIKVTLKSLLARKLRFALTGLAVVIGVSFMAGTFMLTDSINAAFASVFTQPALGRATTVRARSAYRSTGVVSVDVQRAPIPDSLVATVTRVPGVKAAAGMVQGFAQMVGRDGRTIRAEKAPMLGTNWIADPDLSVSRLARGRGPVNGDEVAVDAATFKRGGFHLGDRATVLTAHAPRQFTIVGSLSFGGSPSPGGATVIAFDGPTAQAMVGRPGAWDEIEVAGVRPGTSATVLTERIGAVLPGQYEAVTSASVAAALAKSIQRALGRLPAILMVFAGVAVFAAVFIVYNSFAILVAQRSRELALLRAIGAGRGQVTRSVVGEAALVGVMASGFGLALGALAALGLERVFTAAGFVLPATRLHLSARTVLVSAVTGTAVTVVSSILPARHASRVPPVAAMSEAEPGGAVRSAWPPILGAVVMAAGTATLFTGLLGHPRRSFLVGLGGAMGFTGLAALSPRLVVPLARIVGAPARAWGGVTGRLSQQNAMRNPTRTAAMAAALTIGVALVTIMATVGASVKATMTRAMHNNLRADYVVSTTGGGLLSAPTLDGFSSDLAAQLRARPELAAVAELRAGYWHHGPGLEYLSAIDAAVGPRAVNLAMSAGSASALGSGQVLVEASVAARQHLSVGDQLRMGFDASGDRNLVVGGTFRANEFVEGYVVSLATYEANYPKGSLDQRLLIIDRAGPASSLRAIRQLVDPYRNLEVQDSAALKAREQRELDTVIHLGYVLMTLSILVALIGILNTLALSVVERRRELGLLRAVGMHRSQVRRMVRGESVQVCLIGAVIGIVAGAGLGVALVAAHSFGTSSVIRVPATTLVVLGGLAAVAGVVAAVIPAHRAARLDVLDAIALR